MRSFCPSIHLLDLCPALHTGSLFLSIYCSLFICVPVLTLCSSIPPFYAIKLLNTSVWNSSETTTTLAGTSPLSSTPSSIHNAPEIKYANVCDLISNRENCWCLHKASIDSYSSTTWSPWRSQGSLTWNWLGFCLEHLGALPRKARLRMN